MAFPTLQPVSYVANDVSDPTWSRSQGVSSGLIGVMDQEHDRCMKIGDWGGVPLTTLERYCGNIQMAHSSYLYVTPQDLSAKSGDLRDNVESDAGGHYTYYRLWAEWLVNEPFAVVGTAEDRRINGAYGTMEITIDCGDDDTVLFVYVLTDKPDSWTMNPLYNDAGAADLFAVHRQWSRNNWGRVEAWNIPGGTGNVRAYCGTHGADVHMAGVAIKLVAASGGDATGLGYRRNRKRRSYRI